MIHAGSARGRGRTGRFEVGDLRDAVERLERRKQWGRGLTHEAQRLRDEAVEPEADPAEVERLRAEGLPVPNAQELAEADEFSPDGRRLALASGPGPRRGRAMGVSTAVHILDMPVAA